jgi:hypothetical protein
VCSDKPGAVAGTHTVRGGVLLRSRLRPARTGARATAAAHADGFTDTELAEATTLLGYTAPVAGSC